MRIAFTLLSLLTILQATAQNSWQIAYAGHNAIIPGINVGRSFDLNQKTKIRKEGRKVVTKINAFQPQVGMYFHKHNELNLTVGSEILRQRTRESKAQWSHTWGLGLFYMRSFNAGNTYEIVDGQVEKVRGAGQNYFAPSFSYTLSRKVFYSGNLDGSHVFLKPMVFFMTPYNQTVIPNINLLIGLTLPSLKS